MCICSFLIYDQNVYFRIRFTLVSEPPEDDQEGDCEDVGVALVSIRDILSNRKDVVEEDIDSKYS